MKKVSSRSVILLLIVASVAAIVATGAGANAGKKAADVQVCVLLPDTKSSVRWVQFDAPAMKAAFAKAGVTASINNALNDPAQAEGAGAGLHRRWCDGRHRDRTRQRLCRIDRGALHVEGRQCDRL